VAKVSDLLKNKGFMMGSDSIGSCTFCGDDVGSRGGFWSGFGSNISVCTSDRCKISLIALLWDTLLDDESIHNEIFDYSNINDKWLAIIEREYWEKLFRWEMYKKHKVGGYK